MVSVLLNPAQSAPLVGRGLTKLGVSMAKLVSDQGMHLDEAVEVLREIDTRAEVKREVLHREFDLTYEEAAKYFPDEPESKRVKVTND